MFGNVAGSADKQERALGVQMLDKLDEFFDALPDRAFTRGDGQAAMATLRAAKDEYAKAARTAAIEKMLRNASLDGGGEAALRNQFRQFLKNDKKTRGFSKEEIAAIEAFVTKGSPVGNLFRALSSAGGLPQAALMMTGVQTGLDRAARGGGSALRDMVASGSPQTSGDWLRRLVLDEMPGTSAFGPAGLGVLATQYPGR